MASEENAPHIIVTATATEENNDAPQEAAAVTAPPPPLPPPPLPPHPPAEAAEVEGTSNTFQEDAAALLPLKRTADAITDDPTDPTDLALVAKKKRLCRYPGCTKTIKSQGHCQRHGARAKRCKIEGCDKQAQGTHDGENTVFHCEYVSLLVDMLFANLMCAFV